MILTSLIAGIIILDIKHRILFLYLVAFGVLWLGYALFIHPLFSYAGFIWVPNVVKIVESLLIIFVLLLFLPSKFEKPSDLFVHIQFLFPILPMLVLFAASDYPRAYMYFAAFAFVIVCILRKLRLPKIRAGVVSNELIMWGSFLFVCGYIVFIIALGGLAYFNLDIKKVYEFRVDAAHNLPGIAGYLTPLVSNILLPFIVVLAVSQKKWAIACMAYLGSIMIFGLSSNKITLFCPFIAIAVYFILKYEKQVILLLLGGYILLIFISLAPFFIQKGHFQELTPFNVLAGSLVFRRSYFVPAFLNFAYYDFFSINPHTLWAESKLTFGLVDYPYDLTATHLIGYAFFDNADTGANTGWLGSGYMHLGFLGMVLYAVIIGVLLGACDMISKKNNLRLVVAILTIPFLAACNSSDLPTAMLTHGLLFALLLVWIIRTKQNQPLTKKPYPVSYNQFK